MKSSVDENASAVRYIVTPSHEKSARARASQAGQRETVSERLPLEVDRGECHRGGNRDASGRQQTAFPLLGGGVMDFEHTDGLIGIKKYVNGFRPAPTTTNCETPRSTARASASSATRARATTNARRAMEQALVVFRLVGAQARVLRPEDRD